MKPQRILQAISAAMLLGAAALLPPACGSDGPGGPCARNGNACNALCDSDLGCVECLGDGDCGAAAPFCVTGHCEECAGPGDCGAAQACFPGSNECRPACAANSDCTDGNAKLCDLDTGACVECIEDANCPADQPICSPEHGTCGRCASNADCGAAAPICDLSDGECRECIIDSQCVDGGLCDDHHCKAGCKDDSECPSQKPFCAPNFQCTECLANSDCPTTRPFCNANGQCGQCIVSADCNPTPATPICFESIQCVQCVDKEDCPAGNKCKDHVCEP